MKSKRALSPILLLVIVFVVCLAGASAFVLRRKLMISTNSSDTLTASLLAQQIDQLTERVTTLETAKPASFTITPTPDDTGQTFLEKRTLEEMIQDRLIGTHLTTQSDTVTLSHLPNQNINFFSIPKSIWNQYARHTFTVGDSYTTQLKLDLPPVPRQTSGILTMQAQAFNQIVTFVNDTIANSTTTVQIPPSPLCDTANKDYSFEVAATFFKTKFPEEDWTNPCARVQTFNLKPHLVPGETQKKEFRGYLFLPTRDASGIISGALFSEEKNPLYASALIIPRIKSKEDLPMATNASEFGTFLDWKISFSSPDENNAAFIIEKHKLQSMIDLFMRTAEIPSCYAYGGCY